MAYKVELLPQAGEDLRHLEKNIAQRVLRRLKWISENFDTTKLKPLTGELKRLWKLRAGSYRIIYNANKERQNNFCSYDSPPERHL